MEVSTDYYDQWMATEGQNANLDEEYHLSLDLSEATYRIPFDVLDENHDFMAEVMTDFIPYQVFEELFTENQREVEVHNLFEKEYMEESDPILSENGSFMGDGLSFIHLTLLMAGVARAAQISSRVKRPLGQSVGDDLFLIKAKLKYCLNFLRISEGLGCKFSKINSISRDAATFCEQYFITPNNLSEIQDLTSFSDSIFKDVVFLDTIKGSVLSGKPKVKADKASPFIGHAVMATKQIRWNPLATVKQRAKVFLWARNYRVATGLGTKFAALPIELGGLGIEIGDNYDFNSEEFKTLQGYFEAMLNLEDLEFLKYYLLLRGIFQANPKGFSYLNDWTRINNLIKEIDIIDEQTVDSQLPDYLRNKSQREKLSFINNTLKYISFHDLVGTLARYEAFLAHWNCEDSNTFMSMPMKDTRRRVNHAIAIIKSNIVPVNPVLPSIESIAFRFRQRTWGRYVHKEDPVILHEFYGMPSLEIEF
jgi:hypothetical protein